MRRREPYYLIRADLARSALALILAVSTTWAESPQGADIFEHKCATCHRANSGTRAPLPEVLRQMSRDSILRALESGAMKPQGDLLSASERVAVAEYFAGSNTSAANAPGANVPVANRGCGGCTYRTYKAPSTVKTAVSVSPDRRMAYFGDTSANVYALDASTGSLLWKANVDSHPAARITGSPLLFSGRLYVPVSSGEEGSATDPKYPCCTFRGSVVALDAQSGKQIWKAYTIPEAAKPTGRRNAVGTELSGPSGAAVWSPPSADPGRR